MRLPQGIPADSGPSQDPGEVRAFRGSATHDFAPRSRACLPRIPVAPRIPASKIPAKVEQRAVQQQRRADAWRRAAAAAGGVLLMPDGGVPLPAA